MKHIILLFTALLLVLTGCKQEPNVLSESERNASLVFDRADITGAEYLTVTQSAASKSKSATDDRNVFKIDKDGHMTAVVFYMSYTKDPNGIGLIPKEEVRADVKVIPEQIASFGGIYTYFANCRFIDGNGESIWPDIYSGSNDPASGPAFFLIRNSDGAVFHDNRGRLSGLVPSTYESDANRSLNTISFDKNNDMYFSTSSRTYPKGEIYKLTLQGERNLSIQGVTPMGMESRSFVLSSTQGALVAGEIKDGIYNSYSDNFAFYPDGGFEQIKAENTLCATGNSFKFFKQESSYDQQTGQSSTKTTIKAVSVSAQPPLSSHLEAEVSVISQFAQNFSPKYSVDCKNHYIIGGLLHDDKSQLFVVDKSSKNIQIITLDQFPKRRYTYATDYPDRIGNTIFSIDGDTKTIQSYNFETLQYREVQYDDSELGGFFERGTTFKNDPPAYIKYGTRGSDGKPVTVEINIETGATKVTVDQDSRETIILVRIA